MQAQTLFQREREREKREREEGGGSIHNHLLINIAAPSDVGNLSDRHNPNPQIVNPLPFTDGSVVQFTTGTSLAIGGTQQWLREGVESRKGVIRGN